MDLVGHLRGKFNPETNKIEHPRKRNRRDQPMF